MFNLDTAVGSDEQKKRLTALSLFFCIHAQSSLVRHAHRHGGSHAKGVLS